MARIAGIDPGKTGACALYEVATGDMLARSKRVVDIMDLPIAGDRLDSVEFKRWLLAHHPDLVVIEVSRIRPTVINGVQRHSNAANMGKLIEINGMAQGVVECLGIPLKRADPVVWKRAAGVLGAENKDASLELARSIAGTKATREWLRRKKDHNRAEALLLAVYGAQLYLHKMRLQTFQAANHLEGA